jgi:anti-anti-sigma factor
MRELISVEDVMVRDRTVTVVGFLVDRIFDTDEIVHLGELLYALPEELARTNVIVNLGKLQAIVTYMLGTLIGLQKRIKKANGRLALCQISPDINPVVDEAFEVCGLKKCFAIYLEEQEALQSF